jgi:hypothetical protein
VRCCVWTQLLSRLLFIFFFCLLCEVERLSASQSRRSIPARANGRSHQEPTVDPSKSRRSIPVRADGRSQQEPTVNPNRERLASTSFDTTRLASVHRSPAAAAAPSPLQVPLAAVLRPLSPRPTTNLAVLRHSRRYPRPHPRRWDRYRRLSDSRLQYSRPPGLASSPESGSLTKPLPL